MIQTAETEHHSNLDWKEHGMHFKDKLALISYNNKKINVK